MSDWRALSKATTWNVISDSKPDELSGGYARRVLIARSFMHNPQLVILDEPTVGLDPHVRHQLWETILDLKRHGVTVVLTTHYLDEAEFLSDRIVVLDKGVVRLIDTPQGLKTTIPKITIRRCIYSISSRRCSLRKREIYVL